MYKKNCKIPIALALVAAVIFSCISTVGCKKKEPVTKIKPKAAEPVAKIRPTAEEPVTIDNLADAIEKYISEETAKNNGNFVMVDEKTDQQIMLKFDNVHREKLAKLAPDHYFTCVDFKDSQGKVYDLDFFMKGLTKDDLVFTEFMIHKVGGEKRYEWIEVEGFYKKKPLDSIEEELFEDQEPESEGYSVETASQGVL